MTTINDIADNLRSIWEGVYERKIGYNLHGIIRQHLNIRKVQIMKGYRVFDEIPFFDILDDAEDRGVIDRKKGMDAGDVDYFLQGQSYPDKSIVYVALDVSVTVSNSDITRVSDRAETLRIATGKPTFPVVVGSNIDEARQEFATARGVALIAIAD